MAHGTTQKGWAMTEQEERLARERKEIASRVANFRATQEKFEREREEYYAATLSGAWDGFLPAVVPDLSEIPGRE
jgi:hypothetical protein